MSIRRHLIGRCAALQEDREHVELDLGSVIRRLLLFDKVILDSIRLMEVPALVDAFGSGGLTRLLRSKALAIRCDALTFGQVGQLASFRRSKGLLPLGSYDVAIVGIADREKYLEECYANVDRCRTLANRARRDLERAIGAALIAIVPGAGKASLAALPEDLGNLGLLRALAARAVRELEALSIDEDVLDLRVRFMSETDFRVESNLSELTGLSLQRTHKVLERAVLAVCGLNLRIEDMKNHGAMSGVLGEEALLFGRKLQFLAAAIAPQVLEEQFARVVEINNLPDIAPGTQVSVDALLGVRASDECQLFRRWLAEGMNLSDSEIREAVRGLRARAASALQTGVGKSIRFLTTVGLGAVPGIGALLGGMAAGLDRFVAETLLAEPGPAAFVNRLYPSILRQADR